MLETKLRQPRVTVWPATEWPKELAIVLRDRHVIDARETPPHQAIVVKLPVFIAVGSEPVA